MDITLINWILMQKHSYLKTNVIMSRSVKLNKQPPVGQQSSAVNMKLLLPEKVELEQIFRFIYFVIRAPHLTL